MTEEKIIEEKEEVLWFECYICNLREKYDEKITNSKSFSHITFTDGGYVVKDPFTPFEKKQFFLLGSDCHVCKNSVCQSTNCSIFFKYRYCQNCAFKRKNIFPEQLHAKIKCPS